MLGKICLLYYKTYSDPFKKSALCNGLIQAITEYQKTDRKISIFKSV